MKNTYYVIDSTILKEDLQRLELQEGDQFALLRSVWIEMLEKVKSPIESMDDVKLFSDRRETIRYIMTLEKRGDLKLKNDQHFEVESKEERLLYFCRRLKKKGTHDIVLCTKDYRLKWKAIDEGFSKREQRANIY